MQTRFDPQLFDLIPHRPPMLLINQVLTLDEKSASSLVILDSEASFFEHDKGVPSWVGLEYMGQTAALIAGYQLQQGTIGPHLGFLLGTRAFKSECDYFKQDSMLRVSCKEKVIVGDDLATFDCMIETYTKHTQHTEVLATASLSVLRRPIEKKD